MKICIPMLAIGMCAYPFQEPHIRHAVEQKPVLAFRVEAIPTLAGGTNQAHAINSRGTVVGESRTAEGDMRGFKWNRGEAQELPMPKDFTQGSARSINSIGDIVGHVFSASEGISTDEVLWYSSGKSILLSDSHTRVTSCINDLGIVVGVSDDHACKWEGAKCNLLHAVGEASSWAEGINTKGVIVGFFQPRPGVSRAFLWKAGRIKDLGTLGGDRSEAIAINDSGTTIGTSR